MTIYLIANIDIDDRERYAQYEAGFMDIFSRFDGRMLAVDEQQTVLEGAPAPTRSVLIEFPDEAAARAWYESPEYQALAAHRFASSTGSVTIIQGLET